MIALMETERTVHQVPVAVSCRALGVSESWFYKHHGRPPTRAEERRGELDIAISRVFTGNDGEYGSPRVHAELIEQEGWHGLSVNTVAERMHELGLRGKHRPRRRSLTRPDKNARAFPNLLQRNFKPEAPNVQMSPGAATSRSSSRGKARCTWRA